MREQTVTGVRGEETVVRAMTTEEIEERAALNIANTAGAIRRRQLAQAAETNGKGGSWTSR